MDNGREVKLRFVGDGLDMVGWGIVYIVSYIALAIPQAWWERSYCRWLARKTRLDDGSAFAFEGNPKEIWFWFPLPWILRFAKSRVHDPVLGTALSVAGMLAGFWVSWRVLMWFCKGLHLSEATRFRFTGKPLTYIGLQILNTLSVFTVVGWAWLEVYIQKWIYRHMDSDDAELRMVGKPVQLLGLGLLFFGIPLVIVLMVSGLSLGEIASLFGAAFTSGNDPQTEELVHRAFFQGWNIAIVLLWMVFMPWMLVTIWKWFVKNTRLLVKDSAPVMQETPVLSA